MNELLWVNDEISRKEAGQIDVKDGIECQNIQKHQRQKVQMKCMSRDNLSSRASLAKQPPDACDLYFN